MNYKEQEIIINKLTNTVLPLYNKEFPIVFFWSPKGGCTSLVKWYFFQNKLLQKALDYHPWVHEYRARVYQKQENYKEEVKANLLNNNKDIYKLVRDPYKRAVSSFLASVIYEPIRRQIVSEKDTSLSFKQFLYRVKNIGVESSLIDTHIAQQYVEKEETFIKNYIKLEEFTEKIRKIESKYNLSHSPIESIISSHHNMRQQMGEGNTLHFSEVEVHLGSIPQNLPQYDNFYDQEAKDLVKELFKNDLEKYSYI